MTNKDAIKKLKTIKWILLKKYDRTYNEALDIAIEVLEQAEDEEEPADNDFDYCEDEDGWM